MEKQRKGFFGVCLATAGILASLFGISSCSDSAGLGQMVDTSVPSISITYPPAGSAIRDWFTLSGTCSDDIQVALVAVTMTNLDTGATYDLGSAVPWMGNTWSINVNMPGTQTDANGASYKSYPIPDGQNYQVTATVYDYAGHSTTDKRSFAIDNTPPVVVLSSPTSYGSDTPKSFGRVLKVKGDFSELNNLASMQVNVYDKPDGGITDNSAINLIASLSFSNIDELTEYTLARYYVTEPTDASSDEYRLYQNYKKIYGDSDVDNFRANGDATTKPYYLTFRFSDGAKSFQNPGDGGSGDGNVAEQYFIKDTSFEQNFTSSSATTPLTVANIRQIMNGSHASYNRSSSVWTTLTQSYSANYTAASSDYTQFARASSVTINPRNNPTFIVSKCAWADRASLAGTSNDHNGLFRYIKPSPLTITFNAGVDQDSILFNNDTKPVSVFAVPLDDVPDSDPASKENVITADVTSDTAHPISSIDIDDTSTYPTGWILLWTSKGKNLSNDTSYTPSDVNGVSNLAGNKVYKIFVIGEDTVGNDIEEYNGAYVFYCHQSDVYHEIAIGSEDASTNTNLEDGTIIPGCYLDGKAVDNTALAAANKFKFKGTASSGDSSVPLTAIKATYKITDISTGNQITSSSPSPASVTPVDKGQSNYEWEVDITDSLTALGSGNFKYEVTFTTVAASGTPASVKRSFYVDNAAPTLTVSNMATDKQVIVGSNEINYITATTDENTNETTYTYSFRGDWSDVNGLATDKLQYSICPDTAAASPTWGSWITLDDDTVPKVTTKSGWSANISVTPGMNKGIKFRAIDAAGNIYEPDALVFTGIDYDFDTPSITIDDMPAYTSSGNLILKGTVSDALLDEINFTIKKDDVVVTNSSLSTVLGKMTFTVKDKDGTVVNPTTTTSYKNLSKSYYEFEVKIPAEDATNGVWAFSVSAKDKVGTAYTKTPAGTFYIDTKAPVWKTTWTLAGTSYSETIGGKVYNAANWYNSQSLAFVGAYEEELSGIDDVYYWIHTSGSTTTFTAPTYDPSDKKFYLTAADGTKTELAPAGNFSTTDNGTIETFKATLGSFAKGKEPNYIYFIALDKAGNQSASVAKSVLVDQASPLLTSDKSGTIYSNKSETITVTGTYADDASGIDTIVLKLNNKTASANVINEPNKNASGDIILDAEGNFAGTWSAVIDSTILSTLEDKTYQVTATITDKAGNASQSSIFKIAVDTKAPTWTINSKLSRTGINGKKEISGTVTEANEPVSFKLYYTLTDPATLTPGVDTNGNPNGWTLIPYQAGATVADPAVSEITSASEIYNWSYGGSDDSFKFNFTANSDANTAADGKDDVYIMPVITDSAGNCNIYTSSNGTRTYSYGTGTSKQYEKFTVDLNTDRPTVKVLNLIKSGSEYFLKYGTDAQISGTISDDDSTSSYVVTDFVASSSPIELGSDGKIKSNSATGTTDFDPASGEWTFTPANTDDGSKDVYFYIEDVEGGIFYTANSSTLFQPYFQYKTSDAEDNSDKLTYKSDSKSPVVSAASASDSGIDVTGDTASTTENPLLSSYVVGGTKKQKLSFTITSTDASGIAGITADLQYTENGVVHDIKRIATGYTNANGAAWTSGDKYISGIKIDSNYTLDNANYAQTTAGDDSSWTWTTSEIDISSVPTGSITLNITPYDNAGLSGNQSYTFSVDNSGPAISVTSPAVGEECTGDVSINGTATDTGSAGTYNIQWIVPTDTERTTANGKTTAKAKLDYYKGLSWNGGITSLADSATVSVWKFTFDDNYVAASSDPDNFVFKGGNPKLDVYDKAEFASNENYATSGIYVLPVYFMATDNLGNRTVYESYSLNHNPDGDKPKVEFTYPTTKDYDAEKTYVTLGGTIRSTGSATIPSGTTTVNSIYIQVADENGQFTTADKTKCSTAINMTQKTDSSGNTYDVNEGGYGLTVVTAYNVLETILGQSVTVSSDDDAKKYGFATKALMDAWWGIKANGTASWNIALNSDDGLNPDKSTGTTNNITIRACGVNANGKFGAWTTGDNVIAIHIDDAAPTITSAVNQYASALTSSNIVSGSSAVTPKSVQTFVSDMFLRGQWYLVLDILDETGISELTVKQILIDGSSETSSTLTSGTGYYLAAINENAAGLSRINDNDNSGKKGRKVFIPISQDKSKVKYTVTAKDADSTGHVATQEFTFQIDNEAPSLENLKGNGTALSDSSVIANTDYVYSIEGKSVDKGSGFERLVFYFMRKNGTTGTIANDVVLDPMITTGTDDSKVAMSGLTPLSITQGSESFTLYAKTVSGTVTANTFEGSVDEHVRVGGLVYIDGIYRKITSISGGVVSFEPALASTSSSIGSGKSVAFPIAQVIDNTGSENVSSNSTNPSTFKSGDDGDEMPEQVSKTGTTWNWSGSVHSDNMPDGPVSLVILAFDNAGNVAGKTYNIKISNHAPRLAKIFLATDLNNNSKYENEEFESYNILGAEGKDQEAYTLNFGSFNKNFASNDTGSFTIKNKLAVVPEIVGGNGDIKMVAKKGATTADSVKTSATGAVSKDAITSATATGTAKTSLDSVAKVTADIFAAAAKGNRFFAYELSNAELAGKTTPTESDDGANKAFSFTFWDNTEERTQGTDSQNAVLLVQDFTFDLVDGNAPKVVVNPFYWQSLTSNSIYGSSSVEKVSELNGHIELESDWTAQDSDGNNLTGWDGSTSGTALDSDPKVSGKIVVTGTAYDEHSLGSLKFTFSNGTVKPFENVTMATYSSATSAWTPSTATLASDGYEVKITETSGDNYGVYEDSVYFGQKGHKVYWTLSIDTEKLGGTVYAAKDMVLTVLATDLANNVTSTEATKISAPETSTGYIPGQELSDTVKYTVTDGTTNKPTYTMDVVPYITEIKTSLTSLKKKNPTVYTRTARGHYTVRSDETVTFSGFNLGLSTTLSMSTLSTSGRYDFKVSGISAVNNSNNNNSRGCYATEISDTSSYSDKNKYAYNRIPNNDNNNLLTDDVYFDVWEFNSKAAKPISGVISDPVMKINPNDGMIGFAFTNGPLYFSMPGTATTAENNRIAAGKNSYAYWQGSYDFMSSVEFAYDSEGHTYGVAAGGDINATQADRFSLMTDRWGISGAATGGSYNGSNALRLEAIAQYGDSSGANTGTLNFDKNRVKSPSIATSRKFTSNSTNIYMAYFDDLNEEIRFRYGNLADTQTSKANFDNFNDAYRNNTVNNENNLNKGKYSTSYVQVIADGSGTNLLGQAGEYVAIDVTKNKDNNGDVVVLVWYDSHSGDLKYAYNDNPTAGTTGKNKTNWTYGGVIFTGAGEYCQIVTDINGGLHIAAYDGTNGDLKYAYLSKYYESYDEAKDSCIVDSYAIIGQNLTIDVALDSAGNAVPYIGYYGLSSVRPKIAYKTSVSVAAGADEDEYTGDWEISIVPTASRVPQDRINVGLWKNKDTGVIKDSVIGTSSAGQYFGTCYGNGKKYPILGYQIRKSSTEGYIETAQMK